MTPMVEDTEGHVERQANRLHTLPIVRHFADKVFFHYFWTGGLFTILNIFLVWLFIDILHIPTLISSTVVIGGLFFSRYLVYRWLKVL